MIFFLHTHTHTHTHNKQHTHKMTIQCAYCMKEHNILPQSFQEKKLMRVVYDNQPNKVYFCNLLCMFRSENRFHPGGYKPLRLCEIEYYLGLLIKHPNWKNQKLQWLYDARYQAKKQEQNLLNNEMFNVKTRNMYSRVYLRQAQLDTDDNKFATGGSKVDFNNNGSWEDDDDDNNDQQFVRGNLRGGLARGSKH